MLRLLKVHVQPVFVDDDGEALAEVDGNPVTVPAGQWSTFAASAFDADQMALLDEAYRQQNRDA